MMNDSFAYMFKSNDFGHTSRLNGGFRHTVNDRRFFRFDDDDRVLIFFFHFADADRSIFSHPRQNDRQFINFFQFGYGFKKGVDARSVATAFSTDKRCDFVLSIDDHMVIAGGDVSRCGLELLPIDRFLYTYPTYVVQSVGERFCKAARHMLYDDDWRRKCLRQRT